MRKSFPIGLAAMLALALAACNVPPSTEYTYPAWAFAVSFSAPPKVAEALATADQLHHVVVESNDAGRDFAVYAGDGLQQGTTIDGPGPAAAAHAMATAMGGDVGAMTYASTAAGVLGREFAITKNGKPFATVRIYIANGRFYEVGGQSVLGPDDPAVKAFLDSFRIIPGPPAPPAPAGNAAAHDDATNAAPGGTSGAAPAAAHDDAVEQALARQRAAGKSP